MQQKQSVAELIAKHNRGILTPLERDAFFKLFEKDDLEPEVEEELWQYYRRQAESGVWPEEFRQMFAARMAQRILQAAKPARVVSMQRRWRRYAAAAVVIAVAGTGVYLLNNSRQEAPVTQATALVVPGSAGAVLTLSDGTKVVLDSLGNGVISSQQGADVVLNNGLLEYHASGDPTQVSYNTLEIPRGRQFQLMLPDGSRVWLNAASSIKYPTAFSGKERLVEITGEAFFEVEKNNLKPFRVKINEHTALDVLGTSFNVNAYEQEGIITTTLVDGAIRVNAGTEKQVLKPGQQAQVQPAGGLWVVGDANIPQITAWKNGYFDFNDVDLPVMMRQLERWYDIDVAYIGDIPDVTFKGKMDRNVQLSDVVRLLKNFGINASLEGRKLMISGS